MKKSRTAFVTLLMLLLVLPDASSGQPALRREPAIQPVASIERGDLLLGLGSAYEADVDVPLIAVRGDMARYIVLELAYGVADGIVLTLYGDAFRQLNVDEMGALPTDSLGVPLVVPDEGLADGKSGGAGDFQVGISFKIFGDEAGFSLGGRFQFNVPDSNQAEGLGTNSMMMEGAFLGGYGSGPLMVTASLGVAILEAPAEDFEQNDVVAYGAELLYRPLASRPLRLFAGATGRASTRGRVPVGTEDLGRVRLGADYRLGRWLLDVAGILGYAGNSPDWGIAGGLSVLFSR